MNWFDLLLMSKEGILSNSFSLLDISFQGISLYDADFEKLFFRFLVNFGVTLLIVRALYYPTAKRKDFLFSYLMISIVIFFICFTLKKFEIKTGMALGLFAIFGIIRFRTVTMPVKEMTYLFIVIGLAVINALANKKFSYTELIFTNLIVLAGAFALERLWLLKHESRKRLVYEKIELIKPENAEELKADLEKRTGIKISRIGIGKINFLNDTAQVTIYYYQQDQNGAHFQDETVEFEY